jgi:hypothetical protein
LKLFRKFRINQFFRIVRIVYYDEYRILTNYYFVHVLTYHHSSTSINDQSLQSVDLPCKTWFIFQFFTKKTVTTRKTLMTAIRTLSKCYLFSRSVVGFGSQRSGEKAAFISFKYCCCSGLNVSCGETNLRESNLTSYLPVSNTLDKLKMFAIASGWHHTVPYLFRSPFVLHVNTPPLVYDDKVSGTCRKLSKYLGLQKISAVD